MAKYVDQMGFEVEIPENPQRIISLVPSQTELLFDLEVDDRIVGITKFCVHPKDKVKDYIKIGGTKKFNFDKIAELKPDLIIGNKEENYQEGINQLKKNYPVWMSDIFNLKDALDMMNKIGELTGSMTKVGQLINQLNDSFSDIPKPKFVKRTVYLVWNKPYMVAGSDTFINEMMSVAGYENCIGQPRYPEIPIVEIKNINPEVILLSSEPYPFKEKHIKEFTDLCPKAVVKIVDGEMFSWYGSRLRFAPDYFEQLLTQD